MVVDDQGDGVSCCSPLHQRPVYPSAHHAPYWQDPAASPAQRDGGLHPQQCRPGSGLSPHKGNVMEQELVAQGTGKSSFNREARGEKDAEVFCSFPLHLSRPGWTNILQLGWTSGFKLPAITNPFQMQKHLVRSSFFF